MNQAELSPNRYQDAVASSRDETKRDVWQSIRRGFSQSCPHCGEGTIFYKYLKTRDACETCGEEFHHHRADDAPAYLTIVIVGHILGALMLFSHETSMNLSVWTEAIVWPLLGLLAALWLLPRIKGALVAYQWALSMHGFGGDAPNAEGAA